MTKVQTDRLNHLIQKSNLSEVSLEGLEILIFLIPSN